jgi:hypothetical protein
LGTPIPWLFGPFLVPMDSETLWEWTIIGVDGPPVVGRGAISGSEAVPRPQAPPRQTHHEDLRHRAAGSRLASGGCGRSAAGCLCHPSDAEKKTLADVLTRYKQEVLSDDSEKDGAEREAGMIKAILRDEVCSNQDGSPERSRCRRCRLRIACRAADGRGTVAVRRHARPAPRNSRPPMIAVAWRCSRTGLE